MSKKSLSRFACECNCQRLSGESGYVYLWTFTTADAPTPAECALRWKKAVSQLTRTLGFFGVRVFEMHPSGHGMHVHLVTNSRFDVDDVRDITTRCGFGRINVKRIPARSSSYVAKYINKQRTGNPSIDLPRGVRSWAIVGRRHFGDYTRVSDCEEESSGLRKYRFLRLLYKPESPSECLALSRVAYLVSKGLLRIREASLFSDGFTVEVAGTGWVFFLCPDNCFGFECGFSQEESLL